MPLTMAIAGEENVIKRIGGREDTKKFLKSLGFNIGGTIVVISENHGNIITKVKESRIAISKEMANKIMI
jgi:ferrous iron transport protein A